VGNFGRDQDYDFNPRVKQVRIRYQAGFNFFQGGHPDVRNIKAIAGLLVVHLANTKSNKPYYICSRLEVILREVVVLTKLYAWSQPP
jgi:hypothetical protein